MGGTLSVSSTPGRGAEFTLQVPFSPVEQAPADGPSALAPAVSSHPVANGANGATGAPGEPAATAPAPALASPSVPQRQADLAALRPLLAELDDLLSRNMLGARLVAERVRAELQGTVGADGFLPIEQDVQRLRFPAARSRLASLRDQWAEASSGPESRPSP